MWYMHRHTDTLWLSVSDKSLINHLILIYFRTYRIHLKRKTLKEPSVSQRQLPTWLCWSHQLTHEMKSLHFWRTETILRKVWKVLTASLGHFLSIYLSPPQHNIDDFSTSRYVYTCPNTDQFTVKGSGFDMAHF